MQHLVYASSSSVYGNNKKVPYSTEDKVDKPISLYAATKKSNELLAHSYSKLYNIPSTGLRFFTVYGPAGRPDMAYFDFTNKLIKGEKIQIFNYGNCKRDFTYIDDIVEGVQRVIHKAPERRIGEDGSIGKISENRFARADLEHTLLCVDDDMRMEALRQTNYVKSIVTAQGQMDLERKGKQSYQGWMYARLLAFSNGDLQALYDRSDGFYRRQLILTTREKPQSRVDDPDIAEKMAAEIDGILLWAFEGLQRLVKNGFQFTESDRAKRNRELVKRDNNNVFDFLESEGYIRLKADASTSSKELYEVYKMWCEENSLNAIKARGFSDALIANQRRYNLERTNNIINSSGRRVRGFVGIEALVQPDLTPNGWRA